MPDGPDEYLPGLEPDEPAVEEGTETPAAEPEPSEVEISEESAEAQHSRHRSPSSYVVEPSYFKRFPFPRMPGRETDQDVWARELRERLRRKEMEARHRPLWWAIGLGLLGALATLAALAILFQEDPPDTQTFEPPTAQIQEAGDSAVRPVEGPEEPLSSSEIAEADEILVTALIKCPLGLVADAVDDPTTKTGAGDGANAPISDGFDVLCIGHDEGSHVFTMMVEGDGESLSKEEHTSYQVSFIVNNEWPNNVYYDDSGFAVHVSWQHLAQAYAWQVFDSDRSLVSGVSVGIEWLDESTLQVIVDLPGDQVEVTEMRTELDLYISDADDNYVYDHRDVAIWTAQS
jgi:hypothetical protein